MKYQIVFVVFGLACVLANSKTKVDPQIWKNLEEADTTNVLVTFKKADTKSAFARFHSLRLTNRNAILNTQYAILKDHADIVQADVTSMLKKTANDKKHQLAQLWISNELIVRNVDTETVELLTYHPDVESLAAEQIFPLLEPMDEKKHFQLDYNNTIQNEWGVMRVRAPEAWSQGTTGSGVVVGVIDTGARYTHIALSPTYRGNNPGQNHNYNWFAPTEHTLYPSDQNGHGTHCTGSISGTHGIGVAPGSRWISCRGCAGIGCSDLDLLECGNWMVCPTNIAGGAPDCSRAPNIVSNSWGGRQGNSWYDGVITAWRNARIVPIFSAGNSGPNCGTAISPGDRPGAISVGSINENNQISWFSSLGLTVDGRRKPEIAAPGDDIVSASHLYDTGFWSLSGTSMAAPHVAGVSALILDRRPYATVEQVTSALINGAVAHVPEGLVCNGYPDNIRPSNHVGYGRTDALNSVNVNL